MSEQSVFERLAAIDVSGKTEKKNGLTYLSWAWAVDQLMRHDPTANWEYPEPKLFGETMMVFCKVTAFGKTMQAHLPVMDYRNKPIANPSAFDVNTAMQRCLVKAIALHGLGLYIYAGEDLPEEAKLKHKPTDGAMESLPEETQDALRDMAIEIMAYAEAGKIDRAYQVIEEAGLEQDEKVALWSLLPSNVRSAIKKLANEQKI